MKGRDVYPVIDSNEVYLLGFQTMTRSELSWGKTSHVFCHGSSGTVENEVLGSRESLPALSLQGSDTRRRVGSLVLGPLLGTDLLGQDEHSVPLVTGSALIMGPTHTPGTGDRDRLTFVGEEKRRTGPT